MTTSNILRSLAMTVVALATLVLATGCLNDGNESEVIITDYSNATIKTLAMNDNTDVCASLSSYAFTVDNHGVSDPDAVAEWPDAGIIFNSDSLPYGTVADSIKVSMTYSSPSRVMFYHYDAAGAVVDSVDFSQKQIIYFSSHARTRIHVVAADGLTTKDYLLKVNVHQTVGDTIEWQYVDRDVWTDEVVWQRVVQMGDSLLWYARLGDGTLAVRRAALATPLGDWSEPTTVDEPIDATTMYVGSAKIWCVGQSGELFASSNGLSWQAVELQGQTMVNLLGEQLRTANDASDSLLAIVGTSDGLSFAKSGASDGSTWRVDGTAVPAGFPIEGFTTPVSVAPRPALGNATSRLYIVGGTTASGTLTSSTWTYDGTQWAEFPQSMLPAMTGAAVVRYTTDTDRPASLWLLWPGLTADGATRGVWFSENQGVTWKRLASEYASLSELGEVIATASASAFVEPNSYWIYIVGGTTAAGQSTDIIGGQLRKLTFDKRR